MTSGAVPAAVIDAARDGLVDTLGVAIAGSRDPAGHPALALARESAGRAQATIYGALLRTTAADAAFVNGMFAHVLDYDDGLEGMHGHPSVTALPAALAVGEQVGASGRDVLVAYALGVEVAGKLGRAMGYGHYRAGWHKTSTIGIFAATAAAGWLLRLDASQMAQAFGLAASQLSGLTANFGSMAKSFHAGHAARAGVVAASLVRHGMTANPDMLEHPKGVFALYGFGDGAPLHDMMDRLGDPWVLLDPGLSVKGWPCCYTNHRPLAGLFGLVSQHGITAGEVEAVSYGFLPHSDVALLKSLPRNGLEALLSVEYVTAAALIDHDVTLQSFTDPMVARPEVQALMRRVSRYEIPGGGVHSWRDGQVEVAVSTPRGRFATDVGTIPGTREAPLTADAMERKFFGCVAPILGTEPARHALFLARNCAALPNVAILLNAVSGAD